MKASEYRELQKREKEEFRSINHNLILGRMLLDGTLDNILSFHTHNFEDIQKNQLEKLKKIVDFSYLNIPLYKRKYDAVGYKVGDIKTFDDFEKLPLLTKDELIEGFPNDIVKDITDFKYSTRSSGSSGKFVTMALNLNAIYLDTLQGIRQFKFQSDNFYTKEDTVLFIYTCPWWIKNISGQYNLDFLPTTTSPLEALEYIKKIRPLIISTYPTYLQTLCDLDVKLTNYGVKYVIVHSEQSTKSARLDMGQKLGVTVYDEYSSEELTRIALECKAGHYHIEEDASYIEVLNPQTRKNIKTGTGVVVGTNLLNTATPIIRYYLGDIVTIDTNKTCSCGHKGRILTEIQGREMDCIISGNNTLPASAFMDIAYNWFLTSKIPIQGMRYQIAQLSKKRIVVFLKKGMYSLDNDDFKKIRESLYKLVSRDITIDIQYVDNFIYKSNKFKPVINLIGEDDG